MSLPVRRPRGKKYTLNSREGKIVKVILQEYSADTGLKKKSVGFVHLLNNFEEKSLKSDILFKCGAITPCCPSANDRGCSMY